VIVLLLMLAIFFGSRQLLFVIVLDLQLVQNLRLFFISHPKALVLFFFQADLI
jgi:hypothetical protein